MSKGAEAPAHAAHALAAFVEPLIRGRRVAVLGPATLALGDSLVDRGARLVHVYDPDPGRAAEALARRAGESRGPVIGELSEDLGVRDGAFDVVIVPDMTILGAAGLEDAASVVERVRRLVSPSGVALLASPNPEAERFLMAPSPGVNDALGYYELYDEISLQFSEVRMFGQAPFVGYSIVDFSEADPEVEVDTSALEEPEAAEWYVAIASERRIDAGAYSIVGLPLAEVSRTAPIEPTTMPYREPAPAREDRERDNLALTEARTRLSVLTTENEKLREQLADATKNERQLSHVSMRVAELERESEDTRGKVAELQASLHRAETRAEQAEGDVLRLRADLETARVDLEAAREEPATPRREALAQNERLEAARVKAELEASLAKIRDLERQIAALEPPTLRSKEEQAQRMAEQKARAEAAESTARSLEDKLSAAVRERDAALAALEEAQRAVAAAAETTDTSHAADIAGLEAQLRERGHEVARLKRELREGERVGKELLLELEDLRAVPPPFSGGDDLRPWTERWCASVGRRRRAPRAVGRGGRASGPCRGRLGRCVLAHLAARA
ncbi:MAG: hypothetical protein HOV80_14255 [Polyangiaceae bacterium]|nr:hypothetical protein [Polyangiaceae bacterium]